VYTREENRSELNYEEEEEEEEQEELQQ